jgi:hypothetical protein
MYVLDQDGSVLATRREVIVLAGSGRLADDIAAASTATDRPPSPSSSPGR